MLAASALATTTGAVAAPTTTTRIEAGTALARLIYPPELDDAVMALTFNAGVAPTYHADPNLRPLEAAHPGLIDAMITAMRVEYRRARTAALPTLWARTGAVYALRLDDAELRRAIAFLASDAARRIRALEIAAIAKAPPADAGADAFQLYPADPMPADGTAQGVFNTTQVGKKLAAMQAEVNAINNDWSGKAAPPAATVEAALARVMTRFGAVPVPPAPALSRQKGDNTVRVLVGRLIRVSGSSFVRRELQHLDLIYCDNRDRGRQEDWVVRSGVALNSAELTGAARLVADARNRIGDLKGLCILAVAWVERNPQPAALALAPYDR